MYSSVKRGEGGSLRKLRRVQNNCSHFYLSDPLAAMAE